MFQGDQKLPSSNFGGCFSVLHSEGALLVSHLKFWAHLGLIWLTGKSAPPNNTVSVHSLFICYFCRQPLTVSSLYAHLVFFGQENRLVLHFGGVLDLWWNRFSFLFSVFRLKKRAERGLSVRNPQSLCVLSCMFFLKVFFSLLPVSRQEKLCCELLTN